MNATLDPQDPTSAQATVTTEELPGYADWLDMVMANAPEPTP